MKKKTVLHIIQDLDAAGAQTVVMNYLRYFASDPQMDFRLAVIGVFKHSLYTDEVKRQHYPVLFYSYKPFARAPILGPILNWIKYQSLVCKAISDVRPDIIHSHQTNILPYVCVPMWMHRKVRSFHTLHSDPYAIRKSFARIATFAFRHLSITPVCVTEMQAERARKRYHLEKLEIVHNGLDERLYGTDDKRKEVRTELGISENEFVVGCVGRLDKIKNHSFLIRVFAEYAKTVPNAKLILIGEGGERENLTALSKNLHISEKVVFAGLRSDVPRLYQAMDLFMLTSFFESCSIATIEAQLSGVRCVIASSIPDSVVVTNNVNRIRLDAPLKDWLDAMNGNIPPDKIKNEIASFTMRNTVKELKSIYGL